ncbi:MAG: glycosyltransferase family 2 protein [Flavobacteriales bacterium]|nr:glycosyltransferase family 2 protein [Flavobacteriales bacterium]MCC6937031.1 glycosyltransferase family 2 protein [Flavobacteriales bacterium]
MQVSIVLPCHNAERFLDRCLDSLFAQTHPELELIAVDDGSTDGTRVLLEAAAARSPFPFRVIHQANAGACAARNAGWKVATGRYIQFMDADDELLPGKIAHQVALLEKQDLPGLIVGSAHTYAADGSLKRIDVQVTDNRDPWLDHMRHELGGTPTNLWEREALVSVGGWDAAMKSSQEYDLMFRLLQQGVQVAFDPEVGTHIHLQASGSVSTSQLDATWIRFIALRERIIAHVARTMPDRDLRPFLQVLFDSLRTLYPYAPKHATDEYRRLFPEGFAPQLSPATGRMYIVLHRVLGFAKANRVRQWFGR